MSLTRKQFDVLKALALSDAAMTQRELEKKTRHSLGTVNKVLKELAELGYLLLLVWLVLGGIFYGKQRSPKRAREEIS